MSNKAAKEKLIAAVLLMVFLALILSKAFKKAPENIVLKNISVGASEERLPLAPPAPEGVADQGPIEGREPLKEEPVSLVEYTADEKKNPLALPDLFKKAIAQLLAPKPESIVLPSLTVSGIAWGGSYPQAIINGKIVRIGDTIEGAEILEIKKEGVVVSYKGREFTIPVARAVVP